jgi:FAD/FMN-containing dehydrogenase
MVATNAGGNRVLRYGPMRHQVVGVEVVLADGSVLSHLGGLLKDNTGYDLAGLLVGSEGTLGVVTAARLRLVPRDTERTTAVLALRSVADAVEVAARLRDRLASLDAVEGIVQASLSLVADVLGLVPPFAALPPVALLVEVAGRADPTDELAGAVGALGERVVDAVVATDDAARRRLWAWREGVAEAVARTGIPHKLDVTLPLARLDEFATRVPDVAATAAPGARCYLFGHLGDGNLHVNVLGVAPDDERVDDAVLRLVVELGGSISAEHGIGTAKQPWLALQRSAAELAAMAAIKHALDPAGVLNPHALLGVSPPTAGGPAAPA